MNIKNNVTVSGTITANNLSGTNTGDQNLSAYQLSSGVLTTLIGLLTDNTKLLFGTGQDASIYYDATNLVINPKEVGSGIVQINGNVQFNNNLCYMTAAGSKVKYGLWDSTATTGMGLINSVTFGALNDYAVTFQAADIASRGFWWGDTAHTLAQGAMALTTDGKLTVASCMRLGYGESDATDPSTTYRMDVNGTIRALGDTFIQADNKSLILGAGNDAKIYYNGIDLHINPKAVGYGRLVVDGSVALGSLVVDGSVALGNCKTSTTKTTVATTSKTHIGYFFGISGKLLITGYQSSTGNIQTLEILYALDDDAYFTTYGNVFTGSAAMATIDVENGGMGNAKVSVTQSTAGSTTWTVVSNIITAA